MRRVLSLAVATLVVATGCREVCKEESGHVCTWAGTGEQGRLADGLDRLDSRLNEPIDVEFAPDGTGYIVDFNNHQVRKVALDGKVTVVWGNELPGDGAIYDQDADPASSRSQLQERQPAGLPALDVGLNHPTDVLVRPNGELVLAAWHNHKIRHLDLNAGTSRISCGGEPGFLGDGGPAAKAKLKWPKSLVFDAAGDLLFIDQSNQRIRKIDTNGVITTVAGRNKPETNKPEPFFGGDGGPALEANFGFEIGIQPEPSGALAIDANGVLYVGDTLNHRIRTVDLAKNLVTTIAGTGEAGDTGDGGPALQATFGDIRDLEFGPDGRLYVADSKAHRVRAIDLASGTITTVLGTGAKGRGEDGELATDFALDHPFGVAFDPQGALFVADRENHRIVKVSR